LKNFGNAGISSALPLLLQLIAFWPVWRWYAARVSDSSDDAWGWVALITAAILLVRFRSESNQQTPPPNLLLPALLTFAYAVSFPFVTPLPRALLAMTAIGATLSVYCFRSKFQLSFCGLLLLSLPLMASLQFYLPKVSSSHKRFVFCSQNIRLQQ